MPGRFGHHPYGGGHPYIWGLVFMIGLAALVALVVYLIVRRERPHAAGPVGPVGPSAVRSAVDPAVEAARLRYAHGQLTREAYAQIVADLTGQPLVGAAAAPPVAPAPPPPPPATTGTEPTPEV